MSEREPGPGSPLVPRPADPRVGDPARPPRGEGVPIGTAPEATVEYGNKDNAPPAEGAGRRGPLSEGYDWLDPPRGPGELGWLAHYRVRRCIGEGGMGLVYEAEDSDLLRSVALKVIRPELVGNPQISQRFLREARAMAALKHDHIVTIYQVGQHRGVPYLAMEYLRGMSLHGLVGTRAQTLGGPDPAARPRDRRRPGRRPSGRPDPPRHQARQHLAGSPDRSGQDPRLRIGPDPGPRRTDHESRIGRGYPGVHGPGAGARRGR